MVVFIRYILTVYSFYGVILFGGTTGKITGQVFDSESDKILTGANIVVDDTFMGVSSDENGHYVIINLLPGTYTLHVTMVGYRSLLIQGVTVLIDKSTFLNVAMTPEPIQMDELVVVAKKPLIMKDVSASRMDIGSEFIKSLPVTTLNDVIGIQAGIEGLNIRGGARNQTAFLVNGFLFNDERVNNPYTSISLNSIKEIQVQTGGFNAEYGNIRSGLINIITDEGDPERYKGAMTVRYSEPEPKHFGESLYDPSSYFLRPYLDPDVCWVGTASGDWDDHTRQQYPSFEGWNTVSEATMADDDPNNDLTPGAAQHIFKWQHRREGDIILPDYNVDLSFGGPVPIVSSFLGDLRFQLSHFSQQNVFIFPLSRDSYNDEVTNIRLTSDLSSGMRLTLTGLYGLTRSVSPYNWKVTPTGSVLESTYQVANLLNSSSGNAILFMPGNFSPTDIYRKMIGAKVNHMVKPDLFYDMIIQIFQNEYDTYQIRDRDTSRVFNILPDVTMDEAPYGYWGYSITGIDGMRLGGWMNLGRDKSKNRTTLIKFDLTNQTSISHQIKMGLQAVFNDYKIRSYTENPSMNTWNRSMVYNVSPLRTGIYIQDKMEYEGFIANLGVRAEYSSANTHNYVLEEYDTFFEQGSGSLIESEAPSEPAISIFSLSPRLGVSHPITEASKLYFNYGHFQSEPGSSYRFRLQRESNGLVTYIGDPNLGFERTIAYELGYSQEYKNYLIDIAAYYKDVTDQPGWVYYANMGRSVSYYKAANNQYEDIRGLEFTIRKPYGKLITGMLNYTYMVRSYGYFGLLNNFQDPLEQREYLTMNPYQEKPQPLPYIRANIDMMIPPNFGPKLLNNFYPLGEWRINLLASYKTGSFATYNPNSIPGIVDNVQWKDRHYIDARISRGLTIGKVTLRLYADISNLFNMKLLSYAGFSDNFDYLAYVESLNFPWEDGDEMGNDRLGDYRDWDVEYDPLESNPANDPDITNRNEVRKEARSYIDMPNLRSLTFLDPRKVTLGINIDF